MRHCQLTASDGSFVASQDFYADISDLRDLASALAAFPRDHADEVRFDVGKRDQGWVHWLSLRAYLYDVVGHAALQVEMCNNTSDPWRREARFTIRCEVASLNRLGESLANWANGDEESLRAELTPVGR